MLAELARRGGATPFAECSEFRDAFRNSVGVPERDGVPLAVAPFKGLRMELPGRGVLGDLIVGLTDPEARGRGERGDLAGEAVEMDNWFKDWARSLASVGLPPLPSVRAAGAGDLFGGDAMVCAGR
jgi:hypothetical protein